MQEKSKRNRIKKVSLTVKELFSPRRYTDFPQPTDVSQLVFCHPLVQNKGGLSLCNSNGSFANELRVGKKTTYDIVFFYFIGTRILY